MELEASRLMGVAAVVGGIVLAGVAGTDVSKKVVGGMYIPHSTGIFQGILMVGSRILF